MRVAVLVAVSESLVADTSLSKKELLNRVATYIEGQADLLPQLVTEERSKQMLRPRVGRSQGLRTIETRADFAWVRLDGIVEALGVRDVREVDGKPVGGPERLETLLQRPTPSSLLAARAMLDESARYNVGPVSRNLNLPTTALFFLHAKLQARFAWNAVGEKGATAVVLSFKERERPTVIHGWNNEPVFSRGRIWIDRATGAVQRTELRADVRDPRDRSTTSYLLEVEFAIDPSLQLLLPRRLREHYETRTEVVDGEAEYVNYRRFQTEGRIIR